MKMDKKLVSQQAHEINYIAYRYDIPLEAVRIVVEKMGVSRKKVYAELKKLGWETTTPAPVKKLEVCNLIPDPSYKLPLGRPKWRPKPIPQPTPTPVPDPNPIPVPPPSGATACIFFNFAGTTVQHPRWNGGTKFTCSSAGISPEAQAQTLLRAQTAFAPFNVAVTDDPNVYNAAAVRQQIIVTATSAWYPNTSFSGVTFIGSLFSSIECPAFVFTDRLSFVTQYVGAIMVHEAGHASGLSHQREFGTNCTVIQEYKPGANMGNPLYLAEGEWIYQTCSRQDDKKMLTAALGLKL